MSKVDENIDKSGVVIKERKSSVKDKGDFIFVTAAKFQMSEDALKHSVTLTHDFYISKYQLTFDEYDKYCDEVGKKRINDKGWGRGRRPVINVTWLDAIDYCNWRSKKEGFKECYTVKKSHVNCDFLANGYRLPTEAEWEFAARGGVFSTFTTFAGSNEVDEVAWYDKNSDNKTHPVGEKKANGLGLFDMSGNVWEWCWDLYGFDFDHTGNYDPAGVEEGANRVLKGGSWHINGRNCRNASRYINAPEFSYSSFGFRMVRTVK